MASAAPPASASRSTGCRPSRSSVISRTIAAPSAAPWNSATQPILESGGKTVVNHALIAGSICARGVMARAGSADRLGSTPGTRCSATRWVRPKPEVGVRMISVLPAARHARTRRSWRRRDHVADNRLIHAFCERQVRQGIAGRKQAIRFGRDGRRFRIARRRQTGLAERVIPRAGGVDVFGQRQAVDHVASFDRLIGTPSGVAVDRRRSARRGNTFRSG